METNYISCIDNMIGLKALPDCSVDMTITSPPYDNLRTYNGFQWDELGVIRELFRVTKNGGVVVWIVSDATVNGSETGTSFRQAMRFMEEGFRLHDTMIWNKGGLTFPNPLRYHNVFEYMFVFSKGKPKTVNLISDRENKFAGSPVHGTDRQPDGSIKPQAGIGKRCIKGEGARFNVWELPPVKSPKERTGHPAQFPVRLAIDHIVSWSKEGDVILDPFMGAGTTAVACIETGRKYIGFEISEEYCEIAAKRIEAAK